MASVLEEEIPRISPNELTDLVPIGEGGFGVAYRARHPRFGSVVYKKLNAVVLGERTAAELKKEARMCILQHANIVALFAIIFEIGHYGIVMEYVPCGSLENFVFIYDICDFGLAKWKNHAATHTTTKIRRGTVAYMAPEVHKDPTVSRTTTYDVYSFGILLWALLSEEEPFKNAITDEQIKACVVNGNRPSLDAIQGNDGLVSFTKKWIRLCWHESPDERPTFDNLERQFCEIRQDKAANPVCRPFLRQPKLAWTTPAADSWVRGVTVLYNIMYVVCDKSSTIRLYNTDTHSPLDRVINVDGMKRPWDIVVCRDDRQLYVADCSDSLWRVSVDDHSYVKWLSTESTTHTFDALSVTSRRLLVTSWWWPPRRLRQYSTTDRQLLRVVELPQYVKCVLHGVETTRGTFVVGHEGTSQNKWQYAVSEVDVTGCLLRTFTDVKSPCHLSLDSECRVLVADCSNHRILLLTSELQLQRVLIETNSQLKLLCPERLCYDELTSRLYVAHSIDNELFAQRVISSLRLR